MFRSTALALLVGGSLVGCGDDATPVSVESRPQRHLTDDVGRSLILRGINLSNSSKSGPGHQPNVSEAEIAQMADEAGFRYARHLIFWGAVEPTEGEYDEAYLDQVEAWLDLYEAHDVKVLLDMHQDVFGYGPPDPADGGNPTWGNGAPPWALAIALDGEVPVVPNSVFWAFRYLEPPVQTTFDRFFAYEGDYRALQDHYVAAWRHVAERFRDHPAVVGYDLMNEPHPGSAWDSLEVGSSRFELGPGYEFDRTKLGPFYQRAINAIRRVDPDTWIYYEPRYGAPGNGSRSYLTRLDDPRPGEPRLVFAPHMYSVGYEARQEMFPTDSSIARWENSRFFEIREADVPLVVGEFGLEQSWPGGLLLTEIQIEAFDRLNASWAYWSFDPGTTPGSGWTPFYRTGDPARPLEFQPNADILVRVYPLATAGRLRDFVWNRHTRVFTMRFDTIPGVTETTTTDIFVPDERFYPDGFEIIVGGAGLGDESTFDDARNVVSVSVNPSQATHVISLVPRPAP